MLWSHHQRSSNFSRRSFFSGGDKIIYSSWEFPSGSCLWFLILMHWLVALRLKLTSLEPFQLPVSIMNAISFSLCATSEVGYEQHSSLQFRSSFFFFFCCCFYLQSRIVPWKSGSHKVNYRDWVSLKAAFSKFIYCCPITYMFPFFHALIVQICFILLYWEKHGAIYFLIITRRVKTNWNKQFIFATRQRVPLSYPIPQSRSCTRGQREEKTGYKNKLFISIRNNARRCWVTTVGFSVAGWEWCPP